MFRIRFGVLNITLCIFIAFGAACARQSKLSATQSHIDCTHQNSGICQSNVPEPEAPEVETPIEAAEEDDLDPRVSILAEGQRISYSTHFRGDVTLTWFASDVDYCQVYDEEGIIFAGDSNASDSRGRGLTGIFNTPPLEQSMAYTIRCFVASESDFIRSVVNVDVAPAPLVNLQLGSAAMGFREDALLADLGMQVTARWVSNSSVQQCALYFFANGNRSLVQATLPAAGDFNFVPAPTNGRYEVECRDKGQNVALDAVGLNFNPPTATLNASSRDIAANNAVTLSWQSTNATSCEGPKDNANHATSGSVSTGNLTSSQSYSITCTGPSGEASSNVSISVEPLHCVRGRMDDPYGDNSYGELQMEFSGSVVLDGNSARATRDGVVSYRILFGAQCRYDVNLLFGGAGVSQPYTMASGFSWSPTFTQNLRAGERITIQNAITRDGGSPCNRFYNQSFTKQRWEPC